MRRIRLFLIFVLLGWASAASAEVAIHFHSKDFASTFPHAFVRLTGTDPSTGQPFDVNYGFTPERLSPAILVGPVRGIIETVDAVFVARSDRHFTLKLDEQQYRSVMTVIERWRSAPQPNYRLNSRNCVHFVAEVAAALGLHAPPFKPLMKKPKSFLKKVTQDNLALIRDWPTQRAAVSQSAVPGTLAEAPAAPAQ